MLCEINIYDKDSANNYVLSKMYYISFFKKCIYCQSQRCNFISGKNYQKDNANDVKVYADVSNEKTKRGPPTKKYISVRNIKAQITNMSDNENSGFKTEYNVIFYVLNGI